MPKLKTSTWLFIAAGAFLALDVYAGYEAAQNNGDMPSWYAQTIGTFDSIGPVPTYAAIAGVGLLMRFYYHK